MRRKFNAASALIAGAVALTLGFAPANAVTSESLSSATVAGAKLSTDRMILAKAKSYYIGPFQDGNKCREYAKAQEARGFRITRECLRHDDGKWWYMMSN